MAEISKRFFPHVDPTSFIFRFANKFKYSNKDYRVLYKAYGLRFIINVGGQARQLSIVKLTLTIGAGIGLMSKHALV
jgi:hypothetical protein